MIDFTNVKKSYFGRDILGDATFRVNTGERVGIVGPNGTGKSTLFNLIIGAVTPDGGGIALPKNIRLGYLAQQLHADDFTETLIDFAAHGIPELDALHRQILRIESELAKATDAGLLEQLGHLQSRFEALGAYKLQARAEISLSGLGFDISDFNRPLRSFSGGWQMRAALARTLLTDPDMLLLDEPSNYLDVPAVEWLQRYLRDFKGTLLLISHDRFLLNSLTNVTIEINAGLVSRYAGDYDHYVAERERRFQSLMAAKANQEKEKERLGRSIARFRAKSTKASQVQSWIRALDKMEEIRVPETIHYAGTIRIPDAPPSGAEMARLENVGHSYDGKTWIFRNVDLSIARGDRIGVVGYNGMGKTTLLRIIAGEITPSAGKRILGHKVICGYQAQEFAEILPDNQSLFNVVRYAACSGASDKDCRNVLASFGFRGDDVNKLCGVLSGGEKIKLAFARIFINPPNLLILDEPTTHLDLAAREGLQEAVRQYKGTVCIVSHDIEFIRKTATSILAMERQTGITKYFGDYDYYREKIAREGQTSASGNDTSIVNSAPGQKVDKNSNRSASKREQRQRRALERKIAGIEKQITDAEEKKSEILNKLEIKVDEIDFQSVHEKLQEVECLIAELTAQWTEDSEALERFCAN